jgi:hypothetical protein
MPSLSVVLHALQGAAGDGDLLHGQVEHLDWHTERPVIALSGVTLLTSAQAPGTCAQTRSSVLAGVVDVVWG